MAAAVSNNITAILNFVALMCSMPIFASGIWLASKHDNECIHWLRWPLVSVGVAFLLVSLTGFVGAYWKKEGLLGVYLVCMAILIVVFLVLIVLAFVVSRPDGAYSVAGVGFREYRLDGFSSWLRDRVTESEEWGKIRACLADTQTCTKLARKYIYPADFFAASLSPIESGCCKPPMVCGLEYSSPISWVGQPDASADTDCALWNNDLNLLCYNCDSCKAGLLGNLRHQWTKVNIILIVALIALICIYLVACSAYKNARAQLFRTHK